MENVFQNTCKAVENGATFKIDLSTGTLKVGKTTVIRNGQLDDMNPGTEEFDGLPVLDVIEDLYAQYKTSIPSEKSDAGRSRYFRALRECDLEDGDMLYGIPRSVAQVLSLIHI